MNYSSSFSKFFSRSSCISCSSNFSSMFVKKVFAGVGLANIIGSMQVAAIPGGCKDFLCHLCMCCFWNFLRIVENNNFNSTNRSEQFSYTEEESGWKKTNLSQACEVDRNFKNSEEVELKGKDGYVVDNWHIMPNNNGIDEGLSVIGNIYDNPELTKGESK